MPSRTVWRSRKRVPGTSERPTRWPFRLAPALGALGVLAVALLPAAAEAALWDEWLQRYGGKRPEWTLIGAALAAILVLYILVKLVRGIASLFGTRAPAPLASAGGGDVPLDGDPAPSRGRLSRLLSRLGQTLEEDVLTNWRLVLLGLTGIVLSIASGWTTWDGMTNFTGNPVLSGLITFGIQGVMLIAAWLIGESFATASPGEGKGGLGTLFAPIVLILGLVAGVIFLALRFTPDAPDFAKDLIARWQINRDLVVWGLGGLVALLVIGVAFTQREILGPYLRGIKIILKNLHIWIMFLSCMATSVFFSFDSLFSTIFPAEDRARAAALRVQRQVQGLTADVAAELERQRRAAARALFSSKAWAAYDGQIDTLVREARRAPDLIAAEERRRLLERRRAEASQKEILRTAASQRANLEARKRRIEGEIARLEKRRPALAAEIDRLQGELHAKESEIRAKKAEALAEAEGVGATGREGRGPKFREIQKVVKKLTIEADLIRGQLRAASGELASADKQIERLRGELVDIDARLAKLGAEAETAEQLIKLEAGKSAGATAPRLDAGQAVKALERERTRFREQPTKARFTALQSQCAALLQTLKQVPQIASAVASVDCAPEAASEAAGRIFAINAVIAAYARKCGADAKLPARDIDRMLAFGRDCIQASALPGEATAEFRARLARIALNRDDKAHRFVVTWNAFLDGNRLAYLALAIALAIDGLVFMSGVFGASVMASPLSEAPRGRDRTAAQLEQIVRNSLGSDRYGTASLVLEALRPSDGRADFPLEVVLEGREPGEASRIRKVLNAGATLGLVARDDGGGLERYFVRSELFEYLNQVADRELERDEALKRRSRQDAELDRKVQRLTELLEPVLSPDAGKKADTLMHAIHPISDARGFTGELSLRDCGRRDCDTIRKALNAGATMGAVLHEPRAGERQRYLVRPEFYQSLIRIHRHAVGAEQARREIIEAARRRQRPAGEGEGDGEPLAITARVELSPAETEQEYFAALQPRIGFTDAQIAVVRQLTDDVDILDDAIDAIERVATAIASDARRKARALRERIGREYTAVKEGWTAEEHVAYKISKIDEERLNTAFERYETLRAIRNDLAGIVDGYEEAAPDPDKQDWLDAMRAAKTSISAFLEGAPDAPSPAELADRLRLAAELWARQGTQPV